MMQHELRLQGGSSGSQVTELQQMLRQQGFGVGEMDGVFGKQTDQAVREFQAKNGLITDGIVGPEVLEALERFGFDAERSEEPFEAQTVEIQQKQRKKKADIHASGSASSKSEAPHRDLDSADQTFESSKYEIDRECIRSVCEPHKGQWRKLEGVRHG